MRLVWIRVDYQSRNRTCRFDGQLNAVDHDAQVQLPAKSAKIRHF
jgi:hypothetical protein